MQQNNTRKQRLFDVYPIVQSKNFGTLYDYRFQCMPTHVATYARMKFLQDFLDEGYLVCNESLEIIGRHTNLGFHPLPHAVTKAEGVKIIHYYFPIIVNDNHIISTVYDTAAQLGMLEKMWDICSIMAKTGVKIHYKRNSGKRFNEAEYIVNTINRKLTENSEVAEAYIALKERCFLKDNDEWDFIHEFMSIGKAVALLPTTQVANTIMN